MPRRCLIEFPDSAVSSVCDPAINSDHAYIHEGNIMFVESSELSYGVKQTHLANHVHKPHALHIDGIDRVKWCDAFSSQDSYQVIFDKISKQPTYLVFQVEPW